MAFQFIKDFLHSFVLKEQTSTEKGYVSSKENLSLIGRKAVVSRELRPAGTVLVDGEPVDVVSEGDYIPKGQEVTIVSVNGNHVVVR